MQPDLYHRPARDRRQNLVLLFPYQDSIFRLGTRNRRVPGIDLANSHGFCGGWRGDKLTRRVFDEIMQQDYVAQKLALPGERALCPEGGEPASLKADVRCYVYHDKLQLIAARLYQGQTSTFRTQGGGFALVRVV